jgi:hypothetical protein
VGKIFVYDTEPGSPSEAAMRLLAQWNSEGKDADGSRGKATGTESSPGAAR